MLFKKIFVNIMIKLKKIKRLNIEVIKLFKYINNRLYILISKINIYSLLKNCKLIDIIIYKLIVELDYNITFLI